MFKSLRERLQQWRETADVEAGPEAIGDTGRKIDPKKLDEVLYDLEVGLLENDVAFPVTKTIVDGVAEELQGKRVARDVSFEKAVEAALRAAVEKALAIPPLAFFGLLEKTPKPFVVMFVGVNGTGKTTTIAKLAHHIQKKGYTCVVAAADTFRAGAIEQLERHAGGVGVRLLQHTAGRMQTNQNLMDQMKKIKRVAEPHLVLFVGDALAGNDAVEQARQFHEAVGIDGVILTKIDADAKGGAALSIAHTIGKPIVFLNTGQTYADIRRFEVKWK